MRSSRPSRDLIIKAILSQLPSFTSTPEGTIKPQKVHFHIELAETSNHPKYSNKVAKFCWWFLPAPKHFLGNKFLFSSSFDFSLFPAFIIVYDDGWNPPWGSFGFKQQTDETVLCLRLLIASTVKKCSANNKDGMSRSVRWDGNASSNSGKDFPFKKSSQKLLHLKNVIDEHKFTFSHTKTFIFPQQTQDISRN